MTHYIFTKQNGFNEVIEATMENLPNYPKKNAGYKALYDILLSNSPRYPIEGEIPDYWKEGDEVKVRLQYQMNFTDGMIDEPWEDVTERSYNMESSLPKRIVAIPLAQ